MTNSRARSSSVHAWSRRSFSTSRIARDGRGRTGWLVVTSAVVGIDRRLDQLLHDVDASIGGHASKRGQRNEHILENSKRAFGRNVLLVRLCRKCRDGAVAGLRREFQSRLILQCVTADLQRRGKRLPPERHAPVAAVHPLLIMRETKRRILLVGGEWLGASASDHDSPTTSIERVVSAHVVKTARPALLCRKLRRRISTLPY